MEFEIKCDDVKFRFQEVNSGCSRQQERAVFVNKAGWRSDDRSVTAESIFEDVEDRKPVWKYVHMHDYQVMAFIKRKRSISPSNSSLHQC